MTALFILVLLAAAPSAAQENLTAAGEWGVFELLDAWIPPGETGRAFWTMGESFTGFDLATPVTIARGARPGPTLCLTAGVHGDELNGIEVVRRTMERIAPKNLSGTVIGVPIVNLHGFRRSSRYLPDRRDLNRFFPGQPGGSAASRIAFSFFHQVVKRCDLLVDMHTGSFHRTNIPQVRANFANPGSLDLARGFGAPVIVNSEGTPGTLRRAANDAGIAAITYEAGEPLHLRLDDVHYGAEGVGNLLEAKQMRRQLQRTPRDPDIFGRTRWVRVDDGGVFISEVKLGASVDRGAVLGTVTDPVTNDRSVVLAPLPGRVIGMALNQIVIPGFAAFHLGIRPGVDTESLEKDDDWGPEAIERSGEFDERPEE